MAIIKQQQKISILGCGWYGFALAKHLIAHGYTVKGSTTSTEKLSILGAAGIEAFLIDFKNNPTHFDPLFFNCDVLIVSIPPKSKAADSDFECQIKHIIHAVNNAAVKQIILISSTGVYADENVVVDESVIPNPATNSGRILAAVENLFQSNQSFTTTIIRFAGLIGPGRNLAKHFAGKIAITNGLAPINLIHLNDCLGITMAIIEKKAFGKIYHGVTPDHPTRMGFYTRLCKTSGMAKPEFLPELSKFKQIDSINVSLLLNYSFSIKDWGVWLDSNVDV